MSSTLDQVMGEYEALADAIAAALVAEKTPPQTSGVVRGLCDFLTYRALRIPGGLLPEDAATQLRSLIESALRVIPAKPKAADKSRISRKEKTDSHGYHQ